MKLKYTAPCLDYSGYGEASRHDVGALTSAGVQVTCEIPNYTLETSDFGELGEMCKNKEGLPLGYKIKVIHTTPNTYPQYFEDGKYHIGRVFWETDKLPLSFSQEVEKCDEIWTGSQHNADAMRKSGVTKPIHLIPEAVDTSIIKEDLKPYLVQCEDTYKFYSIFEFILRKNPEALLTAYWLEFQNDERVSLTLKTYLDNFTPKKRQEVDMKIRIMKKRLGLKKYPPVYLYRELMTRQQIYRFHKTFDCFVSAHRGEGWGIPQMEAMLMGNPIISTNCGGIHEYLTVKEAKLLPYKLTPVVGDVRNSNWYRTDQQWADVEVDALRKAMRYMYENQKKAKKMGEAASELVQKTFSLQAVGKLMRDRLEAIVEENYGREEE